MSKYIDAVKAAEIVSERHKIPLSELVDTFAEVPTADVKEVKHGCWIDAPLNVYNDMYKMNRYNKRTKCSVCEYVMPYEYPRFHICPNCGARMDGGLKND